MLLTATSEATDYDEFVLNEAEIASLNCCNVSAMGNKLGPAV